MYLTAFGGRSVPGPTGERSSRPETSDMVYKGRQAKDGKEEKEKEGMEE